MGLPQISIDERLAMAMVDWGGVPTNWIRRTFVRVRKEAHFYPKPFEVMEAYREAREVRHKRMKKLEQARDLRRLPPPPMSEEERAALMRALYAQNGESYDLVLKRRAFEEEVASKRRKR